MPKNSSNLKVALIGAGELANLMHYPALGSFDDVDIAGLCDLNEDRLGKTAQRFNITQTFKDYRQMLDKTSPDAVYVLAPPHQTFELAVDIIQRGHNLFIEKPPGINTQQAVTLARMAEKQKVITAVGWQRRYHPLVNKAFAKINQAGPIQQVVVSYCKCKQASQIPPYYNGIIDILRCDAIHAVDAMRYYSGSANVKAITSNIRKLDCWYHTRFSAIVQFDNEVEGVLLANWRAGRRIFKMEFYGYNTTSIVDLDGEAIIFSDSQNEPIWKSDYITEAGSEQQLKNQGFYQENRAFIDAVISNTLPHNSLQDAWKTLALVDQIYEASISNETLRA